MKSDGYNADAEKVEKANSKLNPRKGVDEVEKVDLVALGATSGKTPAGSDGDA